MLGAGFGLSVQVVPRGSSALPTWLRTARGLRWPCTYERTCVFICACECGTHVHSTVPVGAWAWAAYSLPGGVCCRIYTGACALHFPRVYMRYSVWLEQSEQCILYVYVCVHGGRHVQPERCTTRREYVYACVVQYMAWAVWAACGIYECLCLHVRTVLVPLAQCLWH